MIAHHDLIKTKLRLETKPQEIPCPSTDGKGKRNNKETVNRLISTVACDEINCMKGYIKESRCSPRTRMRMVMAQMSKHMHMQ